ncbi:hypothetical protein A2364_03415 [candidate division WWE3 bacterium RIFOXYB1_FULL_43_12]|nr:MAG: hypothetical protein A2364_03415 [candidate division WWE3 bacterium RIFOXYB1_FULL_43_12]
MLQGIYLLLSDDTVNIDEFHPVGFQLHFQLFIEKRSSTGEPVNGLDDEYLDIVFGALAVVDSLLHRLLVF